MIRTKCWTDWLRALVELDRTPEGGRATAIINALNERPLTC
jgi:hypothetical protein